MDLGQIFTRRILADYMVSLFTLKSESIVLDPCFGGGVFLESISSNTDYSAHGYEIDTELFDIYRNRNLTDMSLVNADFLLSKINTKYDGVIMNPPYIRHEKIDELDRYGITKDNLTKIPIFSMLPRTANIYMYFVVRAIDVLRANGELIVIFPESWLTSKGGTVFRNYISSQCSVEKRIHVSGKAFEEDALVNVIILKLKKNTSYVDYEPLYLTIEGDTIIEHGIKSVYLDPVNKTPITDYAVIRRGLSTGSNEIFINPPISNEEECLVDIISSPKSVYGYSTKNAITDKLLAIQNDTIICNELKAYIENCENTIRKTDNPKTLAAKIKNKEIWYSLTNIDCKGIIFGYMIRNDMRFILNESCVIVRDNFYIISPAINIHVMFALLNNYYVYAQLESIGRIYGGGMLKLQKYDVESLLLANLSIISDSDYDELSTLGVLLAESGDKAIIYKITELLAKYETVGVDTIREQYEYLKTKRLENGK